MLNPASVIAPEAICAKRGRWKHAACQDGVLEARGAKIIDTARAHPQPKRGEFEEELASPSGDIDEQQSVVLEHAVTLPQRPQRVPKMLEDRNKQHEIKLETVQSRKRLFQA